MPVVRREKGDPTKAVIACSSADTKQQALDQLVSDMYAETAKKPRDALLRTWVKLHACWFGNESDPFPLDETKLIRVSALFKCGGYKSFKNYLSRSKDHHLSLGYLWAENLNRTAQKCVRSVTRGLAGAMRSEAFDFVLVVKLLSEAKGQLAENGPMHPLAMVVCSTYFMLRELEASSIDRTDITFSEGSVTIALPVSKTDWQAKGCKRTWACICDRKLPCPYHVLRDHCNALSSEGFVSDGPLFPDQDGAYCTKAGVVETIRVASQRVGMSYKDADGNHRLSGHTFRITGARFLAASGLDPITVQLLGRWGSNAVLSYLAEAPLMSMSQRMKPLESQRLDRCENLENRELSDLDRRAGATEMFALTKELQNQIQKIDKQLRCVSQTVEDHADQLQGIELSSEPGNMTETWRVVNTASNVQHLALINFSLSPHSWKTKCGWHFSGKSHAETLNPNAREIHTHKSCPKCYQLPDDQSSSSSSSSTDD